MRALKVPKREGEKVRQLLLQKGLLLPHYRVLRDETFLYFPIKDGIPGYEVVERDFQEKVVRVEPLTKYGLSSFDVIGDIAIVDIPEELHDKREEIARALLTRKPIRTVLEKSSHVQGEFRTREFEYVMGEQKSETIHREYGLKLKVDVNAVYFNPRLATERLRIAQKVEPGEVVADMFCGVGPFSLLISRLSEAEKIYAVDINPRAIELLKENIALNKIRNVVPILGDAREEIPKIGRSHRIIMNLPQKAFEFLPEALKYGDIIHYYRIISDFEGEIGRIKMLGDEMGIPVKILECTAVKSYSPDMEMYRIDISTSQTLDSFC